jgi:tetratricopeptide (TPR) repeat protein
LLLDESLLDVEPGTDQEARLLVNKSDSLRILGRTGEALEAVRAARVAAAASGGEDGEVARACDGRMVELLSKSGAVEEAEEVARRALAAWSAQTDAPASGLAEARLRHGLCLARLGRSAEARAALEAGLAVPGVEPPLAASARAALQSLAR